MNQLVFPLVVEDRGSAALNRFAGANDRAAEASERLGRSITDMSAMEQRAVSTAVRHAEAVTTVNRAMTESAGSSAAVQRATLGVVAAQDQLTRSMEGGRASTAQLATAQSALIGAEERLIATQREAAGATTATAAAQREAAAASSRFGGGLASVVGTAKDLGVVLGGVEIGKKVIEFIGAGKDLTTSLNSVQAASQATDQQMKAVRTETVGIGKDMKIPAATAVDAADAIDDLVRAGVKLPRAMVAARPALLLATASHTDMALSARVLGDALDEYRLPAEKAGHVSDVLAAASTHAAGGLETVFDALRYVGPRARAIHVPLTDTTAAIDDLSKAGLQGTTIGTGLAMVFQHLSAPSQAASAALKDLGVNAFDAQGRFRGMVPLIDGISKAQTRFGVDSKRFLGDISTAFGARASNVIAAFAGRGVEGFEQMATVIRRGDVVKAAADMNRGVAAEGRALAKQFTAYGIDIYQSMEPRLETVLHGFSVLLPQAIDVVRQAMTPFVAVWRTGASVLGPVVHWISDIASTARPLAPTLKTVASAGLSVYAAFKLFGVARVAITGIGDGLAALRLKALNASIGLRAVGTASSEMSAAAVAGKIATVGLGVALGVAVYAWQKHEQAVAENQAAIDGYTDSIKEDNGALGQNTRALVENNLVKANAYQQGLQLGIGQKLLTAAALGNTAAVAKVNSVLKDNVLAVGSKQVADRALSGTLGQTNGQLTKAVQNNKDLAAANDRGASSARTAASAASAHAAAQHTAAAAEKAAAAQAKALDTALQNLAQTQLAAAQGDDAFREGILSLTKTINDNHDKLNLNTQAGLANRDALLGMLGQAVSLAQAQKKNGDSIGYVTSHLSANIKQLKQTAVAAGAPKAAVHALIEQMGLTPKDIRSKFEVDTDSAMTAIATAQQALDRLLAGGKLTVSGTGSLRGVLSGGAHGASAAGSRSWTQDGKLPPGYSTVGERGWELARTDAAGRTEIVEHRASMALTGLPDRLPGFAGGTGGDLAAAKAFAQAQNRKPYQMGTAGPREWDCSGLVSGVIDTYLGRSQGRLFSTANEGSVLPGLGFKAGAGNGNAAMIVGWQNDANLHHTTGRIGNVNFEAYGDQGVALADQIRVGGRARDPRTFPNVMHLPGGGKGASGPAGDGSRGGTGVASAVHKLKGGDWGFAGSPTHYASQRAADNAYRSSQRTAASSAASAASSAASGAISNIGQAYSPPFSVADTGIDRVRAQIAAAQRAADNPHLSAKARAGFDKQIAQMTKLANKQLLDLRVKIRTGDMAAVRASLLKTPADARAAFAQLEKDMRAAGAGSAALERLSTREQHLIADMKARAVATARAAKAQDYLNGIESKAADLRSSVRSAITGSFDITSAGTATQLFNDRGAAGVSSTSILKELTADADKAVRFDALLRRLGREGLNPALIEQLAEAGPAAYDQAKALALSTPKRISGINAQEARLVGAGKSAAKFTSTLMFGSQIDAAQALLHGYSPSHNPHMAAAVKHLATELFGAGKVSGHGLAAGLLGQRHAAGSAAAALGDTVRNSLAESLGVAPSGHSDDAGKGGGHIGVVDNSKHVHHHHEWNITEADNGMETHHKVMRRMALMKP